MIKQKTNSKNYGNWGGFGKPACFDVLMYRDLSKKFLKRVTARDAYSENSSEKGAFKNLSILRDIDINETDEYGRTVGIHALIQGHARILSIFIENGGNLFLPFIDGTDVYDCLKEHALNKREIWKKIENLTGVVHPELKREKEWRKERSNLLKVQKDKLTRDELSKYKIALKEYEEKYADLIEALRIKRRELIKQQKIDKMKKIELSI